MNFPTIRPAGVLDAKAVHAFGLTIPELKVSAEADFMSLAEVEQTLSNPDAVFLISERDGAITGIAYANIADADRCMAQTQACFVYLAVGAEYRRTMMAARLHRRLMDTLIDRGVGYVYAWAHPTSGVIEFLDRRGFSRGKECVWMDVELPEAKPLGKLVRDLVPKVIGSEARAHRANGPELRRQLGRKLVEEAREFQAEPSMEELADLLEVVETAARVHGFPMGEVRAIQAAKAKTRGRFNEGIILDWAPPKRKKDKVGA